MSSSTTLTQYLWIAIAGVIFGFIYCFSIGANDVANAFATSVASKSITLKQAVIIASIFEFCGVLFLGASVSSTVRGKIYNIDDYQDEPEIVMLGMFTSLVSASFMMMVATYYGLPVSTTHTVIGCIIGFSVAAKGIESVNWNETKNIFISWVAAPLLTGAVGFFIFLFIQRFILLSNNPFHRGYYTFSFILFFTIGIDLFFIFSKGTKNFEHFQENVYDPRWVVPTSFGVGAVVGILWLWPVGPKVKERMEIKREARRAEAEAVNAATLTSTGNAAIDVRVSSPAASVHGSSIGSLISGLPPTRAAVHPAASTHSRTSSIGSVQQIGNLISGFPVHPAASTHSTHSIGSSIGGRRERRGSRFAEYDAEEGAIKFAVADSVKSLKLTIDSEEEGLEEENSSDETEHVANIDEALHKSIKPKKKKKKSFLVRFEEATYKQNLEEQAMDESKTTQAIWANSNQYDSDVEQLFTYVQVFTAALSSFAHGANDIANAIAPVAAIIDIYQSGTLNPEAPVQKWILAYGGVALSLGLLLYGYKVMKMIGYKLTVMSPTRGSSASLASSLVVATASYIGIPVSTTQCIVGAVVGIGLVEGQHNVQWASMLKCVAGWVIVFFVAAVISAMLFALCAYSPSLTTNVC